MNITKHIGVGAFAVIMAVTPLAGFSALTAEAAPTATVKTEASGNGFFGNLGAWRNWYNARPVIQEADPDRGAVGTEITLTGKRFKENSTVHFGGGIIDDVNVGEDGKTLSFIVPETMDRYCFSSRFCNDKVIEVEPGDYRLSVWNGSRMSNMVKFEVTDSDPVPPSDDPIVISEIDGPTALALGAEGTWTIDVESESEEPLRYSVKWGDESDTVKRSYALDMSATSSATFTHTYTEPGTYQPEFTVSDSSGNTVAKLGEKVMVADDEAAIPYIATISPGSGAAQTSVTLTGTGFDTNSTVALGSQAATSVVVESDTKITFTIPKMSAGTYAVTVTDADGTSNAIDFKVIEKKGKISINSIIAPTRLAAGEVGTWTVEATSNLSGNLRYSVDWGEEMATGFKASRSQTQSSATFTYAYDTIGTFNPKFTVTDEQGNSAKVSASVVITAATE